MAVPLQFDKSFKPGSVGASSAALYYNGFRFPPAFRAQAVILPVMDDSERMVKYLRLTIRVKFYLFNGLNLGTGTFAVPNLSTSLYGTYDRASHKSSTVVDHTKTTDAEMDYLRKRLSEPCQELQFTSQGIGTVIVNDPGDSYTFDVDNGPKPRVVVWRPLTNKCCYIEWEVTTSISPCSMAGSQPASWPIAQVPFTVTWHHDYRGLSVRTIKGRLERALTRVPAEDDIGGVPNPHAGISQAFDVDTLRSAIVGYFPRLDQFHREQNYSLSADRKFLEFTIEDSEIDSDEAFGEGISDADVTLSAANEVPFAFNRWEVTMTGTIQVAAGFTKAYAMVEISRLFNKFFRICSPLGHSFGADEDDNTENNLEKKEGGDFRATDENGDPTEAPSAYDDNPSKAFLKTIRFTDNVYSRRVGFTITWMLNVKLTDLFTATGMFTPVTESSAENTYRWGLWKTSLGKLDEGGFQRMNMTEDYDIIVSLCKNLAQEGEEHTIPGYPSYPEDVLEVTDDDRHPEDPETINAKDAWIDYKARFDLEINHHSSIHSPLGNYDSETEDLLPPSARKSLEYAPVPHVPSYDGDPDIESNTEREEEWSQQQNYNHTRRHPTYILHFYGYAIRANYPVPVPSVEKYGGRTVRPYGQTVVRPRLIGHAIDIETGKSLKIYGLMWHKQYLLPLPPIGAKIKTDGHQDIHV